MNRLSEHFDRLSLRRLLLSTSLVTRPTKTPSKTAVCLFSISLFVHTRCDNYMYQDRIAYSAIETSRPPRAGSLHVPSRARLPL
ncbi:hypothetical protein BU26DRAFT_70056 [Trematosphaeria pertusa]|uniref:Uncharacterized protein n=1 Tax=Trematosphaeria pertusa TaxID=390896 RepID=A0A6A6I4N2_9PLEO|nr:uncharacterized protein BU26DRAFT_70056 [Trematosphaeria pertusa]KAF2245495.1 hypothetical protein BU26DRAFT_70056 [Trematosphaeria pertusa]